MDKAVIGIKLADGKFYPVLAEGSPASKVLEVSTVRNEQQSVQINLFRADDSSVEYVENEPKITYIGTLIIADIASKQAGEPTISLSLSINENNELSAEAIDIDSGMRQSLTVSLENLDPPNLYDVQDFELLPAKDDDSAETDFELDTKQTDQDADSPLESFQASLESDLSEDSFNLPGEDFQIDFEPEAEKSIAEEAHLEVEIEASSELEIEETLEEDFQTSGLSFTDEDLAVEEIDDSIDDLAVDETDDSIDDLAVEEIDDSIDDLAVDETDDSIDDFVLEEIDDSIEDLALEEIDDSIDDFDIDIEPEPEKLVDEEISLEVDIEDFPDREIEESSELKTESIQEFDPKLDLSGTDFTEDIPEFDLDPLAEDIEPHEFPKFDADLADTVEPEQKEESDYTFSEPRLEDYSFSDHRETHLSGSNYDEQGTIPEGLLTLEEQEKEKSGIFIPAWLCGFILLIGVAALALSIVVYVRVLSMTKTIFSIEQTKTVVVESTPIVPAIEPEEVPKPEEIVSPPVISEQPTQVDIIEEPIVPVKPTPVEEIKDIRYKIKWGDTLWDLSQSYYQNPWLYPKIAEYNNIRNPNLIISGAYLNIPPK